MYFYQKIYSKVSIAKELLGIIFSSWEIAMMPTTYSVDFGRLKLKSSTCGIIYLISWRQMSIFSIVLKLMMTDWLMSDWCHLNLLSHLRTVVKFVTEVHKFIWKQFKVFFPKRNSFKQIMRLFSTTKTMSFDVYT